MQSRPLLIMIAVVLLPSSNLFAEEWTLRGEASAVPIQVDIRGNKAKFNEYRDIREGVRGHIGVNLEREDTYLDFQAGAIGNKDQTLELNGGNRGSFQYYLKYDEIPHSFNSGPFIRR